MIKDRPEGVHVWLLMLKAVHWIGSYAMAGVREDGLGESDFRVLEVLLHKGPMPVNTIGPKVFLTPGSISVAVDRLHSKGLVSRVECSSDRRVRIVALTASGQELIAAVFRKHAAAMEELFAELTAVELRELEAALKKAGRRAESLGSATRDPAASSPKPATARLPPKLVRRNRAG